MLFVYIYCIIYIYIWCKKSNNHQLYYINLYKSLLNHKFWTQTTAPFRHWEPCTGRRTRRLWWPRWGHSRRPRWPRWPRLLVWGAGQTHHGRGKGIIRHLGCWADAASKSLKSPTLTKKQQVPAMKIGNWNSNLQVNLSTIDKIDDALKT